MHNVNGPETPRTLGRYTILEPLGEGGMGTVYLAEDPRIGRRLAIKTVRLQGGAQNVEENQQRLLMEARAAGRLLHPNAVALFDADEVDGTLFLAFEYVPGVDLSRRLTDDPPLTLRQVLGLLREIADALHHAHQAGIVHRDIKPSNVLISPEGTAKVADFGLAKLKNESLELTRTGSVLGSPQYMSPEQVRGEPLDGRTDLFSLGVVAYEMLSRLRPFGGETISTLVFEILGKEPLALDHLRPGLPPRLVNLVHGMLAKELQNRVASAATVVTEIEAVLRETPAKELDFPAVPPLDDAAPTRLMESGAPPPPHVPTVTVPSLPPVPPPPPLPIAPATDTTPVQTAPVDSAASAVAQKGEQGAKGSSVNRAGVLAMVALVLGLVVVLGGTGYWLMQKFASSASSTENSEGQISGEASGSGQENSSPDDPPPVGEGADTTDGARPAGMTETPSHPMPTGPTALQMDPETPPTSTAPSATPPPSTPPPSTPPPSRPQQSTPPPPSTPPPSTPPPSTPSPSTPSPSAGTTPPSNVPSSTAPTTPPAAEPTIHAHLKDFDQAARSAQRKLESGLFFTFEVEPEDALVRVWRRGDKRQRVMGQAATYAPKKKDTNALELPEPGEYLITLVAEGFPEYILYTKAENRGSPTPQRIQTKLRIAASQSGVQRFRVVRSLAFSGSPSTAEVYVNGARQGPASRWPGGRPNGPRNLQLDPGLHKIRLEASGYKPYEFEVEVTRNAPRRAMTIEYSLQR